MKGQQSATAFGVLLRAVETTDAAFVVQQRRHARARAFLGDTPAELPPQQQWIVQQQQRPNDWYYICENVHGVRLGTIGLYNFTSDGAEWGRFVIRPGSKAAPAALLLVLRFAWKQFGLQQVVCTTVASNVKAIAFYERAGFVRDHAYAQSAVLQGREVSMVLHRLHRNCAHTVDKRLAAAAAAKQAEVLAETEAYFASLLAAGQV